MDGKMIAASSYGKTDITQEIIEYTDEEKAFIPVVELIWKNVLNMDIAKDTHFFQSGAGSMDVVRLVLLRNSIIFIMCVNE